MKKKITGVKANRGSVKAYFQDGSVLQLTTYRNKGAIYLDSVLLYREGNIVAKAVDKPPKKGFCSKSNISEQELAEYWNAALGLAESRFDDYVHKRIIDDDTWAKQYQLFWLIANDGSMVRSALEKGLSMPLEDIISPQKDFSLEFYSLIDRYFLK
jgi:hypothetical protein